MVLSLNGRERLVKARSRLSEFMQVNVTWHVRFEMLVRYAGRGDSVQLINNAGAQGKYEGRTMI